MWPYFSFDGDLNSPISHLQILLMLTVDHLLLRFCETTLPSHLLFLKFHVDLLSFLFSSLNSLPSGCQGFTE